MNRFEHTADRLIKMGYLKFVPKNTIPALRLQMIETLRDGFLETEWGDKCVSKDRRSYPADSEELAEGRIGEVILLMKAVLMAERVVLDSVQDDFADDFYDVVVNGERHRIHDSTTPASASWALATKRLLEIVNGLLEGAGSSERVYAFYGGNDTRCLVLTEEMYNFLRTCGLKIDTGWMPYPPAAICHDGTVSR